MNLKKRFVFLWFFAGVMALTGCGLRFTSPEKTAEYTFTGDVLLYHWPAGIVYNKIIKEKGWDAVLDYPFEKVREHFRGLVFCNHDGPISDRGAQKFKDKDEKSYFQVSKKYAEILKRAGYSAVFLANNHIKDCGEKGVLETSANLKALGIHGVGAGKNMAEARQPVIIEKDGIKTACLAYDLVPPISVRAGDKIPGAAYADDEDIISDIKAAAKLAEIVVVNFHWGLEMRSDWQVKKQAKEKIALARAAIDAGARIVVGQHSHAVEKIELYKNGIIAYGLGNFMFGASTRDGHKESMMLRVKAGPGGVISYDIVPVVINPKTVKYQPVPMEDPEKAEFMKKLEALSE
jgi:poly-gamma-glutamate capsule biosynthesis protein CapA/YwtB (metallophosphatase superfamily)